MTGNKELDLRYLICIAGEHRTNCRGRFTILAFIKSTNDESWNMSYFKQTSNFFLHPGTRSLLPDPRIGPQDLEQLLSKEWY